MSKKKKRKKHHKTSNKKLQKQKTAVPEQEGIVEGKDVGKVEIVQPASEVQINKNQDFGHEILPEEQHDHKWKWKKLCCILGGVAAVVVLAVYISGMVYFKDKFLMNTKINGFDASYNTVGEVEEKIAKQLGTYKIKLRERDGDVEILSAEDIGYHYVSKGEVQEFKDKQSLFDWPIRLWRVKEYHFASSTDFDQKKLKKSMEELKCFDSGVEKAPKDAYMDFVETAYQVIPEEQGKKVNKKKLKKLLIQSVEESSRELDLEQENCYYKPQITKKNKELNQLVDNLNVYAKATIRYQFGEQEEILDGKRIKEWLTYDEERNVTLDEGQIPAYVAELAEKYDSYNKLRRFQTNDGSYVDVEGGRYGWKIDQEAESAELLGLVKSGAATVRSPAFAQTAASWENSDLGHDYIEIDLTRQHLWMYINGEVVVSSDFVSGDMARAGRKTPAGTFTLYYKKSPSVLRSFTPGDSYETPVTYWMPFNGGVGLHDANWRGSFGGDIYKYNGSHGCINLPTSVAREIYSMIYKEMPIICFYR